MPISVRQGDFRVIAGFPEKIAVQNKSISVHGDKKYFSRVDEKFGAWASGGFMVKGNELEALQNEASNNGRQGVIRTWGFSHIFDTYFYSAYDGNLQIRREHHPGFDLLYQDTTKKTAHLEESK